MNYIAAGIDFLIGIIIAWLILSLIRVIFDSILEKIWNFFKKKASNIKYRFVTPPPEPTVCDKLGSVKIYTEQYQRIRNLKAKFDKEEKDINTLIEHIFPAPQLTNNKFTTDINRLHKAFYKQYKSLHIYFRAYPNEDEVSSHVIHQGYDNLYEFYTALQNLTKELSELIVCDVPIENLMNDIEEEKESIKTYKEHKNV